MRAIFPTAEQADQIRATPRTHADFRLAEWLVAVGIQAVVTPTSEGFSVRLTGPDAGRPIAWRNPAGGFHNPAFCAPTETEALAQLAHQAEKTDIYLCGPKAILLRKGWYGTT
jgi:hypothetical protein